MSPRPCRVARASGVAHGWSPGRLVLAPRLSRNSTIRRSRFAAKTPTANPRSSALIQLAFISVDKRFALLFIYRWPLLTILFCEPVRLSGSSIEPLATAIQSIWE